MFKSRGLRQVGLISLALTVGASLVGYGVREVLRVVGGGYYCCNHLWFASKGLLIAFLGWFLIVALLGHGTGLLDDSDEPDLTARQ